MHYFLVVTNLFFNHSLYENTVKADFGTKLIHILMVSIGNINV